MWQLPEGAATYEGQSETWARRLLCSGTLPAARTCTHTHTHNTRKHKKGHVANPRDTRCTEAERDQGGAKGARTLARGWRERCSACVSCAVPGPEAHSPSLRYNAGSTIVQAQGRSQYVQPLQCLQMSQDNNSAQPTRVPTQSVLLPLMLWRLLRLHLFNYLLVTL